MIATVNRVLQIVGRARGRRRRRPAPGRAPRRPRHGTADEALEASARCTAPRAAARCRREERGAARRGAELGAEAGIGEQARATRRRGVEHALPHREAEEHEGAVEIEGGGERRARHLRVDPDARRGSSASRRDRIARCSSGSRRVVAERDQRDRPAGRVRQLREAVDLGHAIGPRAADGQLDHAAAAMRPWSATRLVSSSSVASRLGTGRPVIAHVILFVVDEEPTAPSAIASALRRHARDLVRGGRALPRRVAHHVLADGRVADEAAHVDPRAAAARRRPGTAAKVSHSQRMPAVQRLERHALHVCRACA